MPFAGWKKIREYTALFAEKRTYKLKFAEMLRKSELFCLSSFLCRIRELEPEKNSGIFPVPERSGEERI